MQKRRKKAQKTHKNCRKPRKNQEKHLKMQKTASEDFTLSKVVFFVLHGLIEPLFCPVRVHNND
jgi:hypothetical protein